MATVACNSRIYDLAEITIVLGFMALVLWITASRFDITEIKSLLWMFGLMAGSKEAARFWNRFPGTAT